MARSLLHMPNIGDASWAVKPSGLKNEAKSVVLASLAQLVLLNTMLRDAVTGIPNNVPTAISLPSAAATDNVIHPGA